MQKRLREVFEYVDGHLYWKIKPSDNVSVGDQAGTLDTNGYRKISVDGERYLEHILIWIYHNGTIPKGFEVDHKDPSMKWNNSIENLRLATRSQNNCNHNKSKRNTSGVKGVCWNKKCGKWEARVMLNGKYHSAGLHLNLIDAENAVRELRVKLHGAFANHG